MMLANFNTKPMSGDNLQQPVIWTVGLRFYPTITTDSTHYKMLQLHKYPIGEIHQNNRNTLPTPHKQVTDNSPKPT